MLTKQPVWITGLGAVTPIGNQFDEISRNLMAGQSGIRPVGGFDASEHPCRIAGQVPPIECPEQFDAALFGTLLSLEQCAVNCCVNALVDSGWWSQRQSIRIGVVLGLGAERMQLWDMDYRRGGKRLFDQDHEPESIAERTRGWLELNGPAITVSGACASGNQALAQGYRWLELGWADVCLVGACDMGVTPYSMASFGNLRALSRRNDEPRQALRPFDKGRDGMVLGEGGAFFVLERADAARRRGSRVYAEVAGFGSSSDATHMVIPCADPQQGIAAMRQAMAMAGVAPDEVDYVNAHATGTPVGDVCETRILHGALGAACPTIPVSSTKSMTGHLLSAAAAVEAIACLTAMHHGVIPPTVNLDDPDPDCNLLHVANQAREERVRVAISNSFGFGGNNTSLVLRSVA
jgi:3-oxoacyl-[acyl-carrier-protein] synthase II